MKTDLEKISIDEVEGSCVKDGELFIKYKRKNLFMRIMDSDITGAIVAFIGIIAAAIFIGFALGII